ERDNLLEYLINEQYRFGLYNLDFFGGLVYQTKNKECKTTNALRQVFSHQASPGLLGPLQLSPLSAGRVALPAQGQRGEQRADGQDEQEQADARAQPGGQGVAPGPAVGPPEPAGAPRLDGPAVEEAPQVVGQGQGTAVTPGGVLVQTLQADRLQIARDLRPQV